MAEVLKIASSVATPLGFLGLAAAIGLFICLRTLKHKETLIQNTPAAERAALIEQMFPWIKIDASNLTRDQRYNLLQKKFDIKRYVIIALFIISCVTFVACFGLASIAYIASRFIDGQKSDVSSPSESPGSRLTHDGDGLAIPYQPLPEDIDFVDADFVDESPSDPRGATLDIKFTNQGYKTAFVKHLILNVKQVWHLQEPPTAAGAVVGPSARYEARLEEEKVPYEAKVSVTNSVEPGKSDEFHLLVRDKKEWSEVYTIYRFGLVLVSNGSDHRTEYRKDLLVFFSEYGNSFPTLQAALSANQLRGMSPEAVKALLDENRLTLREIAMLKNCVMSPTLRKFIESAEKS